MSKQSVLLFILLLFSSETFCQNKNKRSINFGLTSMNFYSAAQYSGWVSVSQTPATCFELNFIEQINISNRWSIPFGGGISQKGWTEEGYSFGWCATGGPYEPSPHKYKESFIYLNLQFGLSYDLISYKRFTFNLGQLITPEFSHPANPNNARTIVASTRTNLSLQYSISKKIGFQLTPFFQTALGRYNKKVSYSQSSNWTPYGYGATFGVLW